MAEFSKLVITSKGRELLAKMIAGTSDVKFTKICSSSAEYIAEQLESLTELSDIRQTSPISKVTRENDTSIKVESAFSNANLTSEYYVRSMGLYATDPDNGEILYGVTIETSGNCHMPIYNGITSTGMIVKLVTEVGNAENVSLEVSDSVYVTVAEFKDHKHTVPHGGTGLSEITAGNFLVGNGTEAMVEKTPSEVFDILQKTRVIDITCKGTEYTGTLDGLTKYYTGLELYVHIMSSCPHGNLTLNINGIGAKPLYVRAFNGTHVEIGEEQIFYVLGGTYRIYYSGSYWVVDRFPATGYTFGVEGEYYGTGTFGSDNPCVIPGVSHMSMVIIQEVDIMGLNIVPRSMIILNSISSIWNYDTKAYLIPNIGDTPIINHVSWFTGDLQWWNETNAEYQLNRNGSVYKYVAICCV